MTQVAKVSLRGSWVGHKVSKGCWKPSSDTPLPPTVPQHDTSYSEHWTPELVSSHQWNWTMDAATSALDSECAANCYNCCCDHQLK